MISVIDVATLIGEDIQALFSRAFLNQHIFAFGADGCGKHGRNPYAQTYLVYNVTTDVYMDSDETLFAFINVHLHNYSAKNGHMCTDRNGLISAQNLLENVSIDRNAIAWAKLELQGESSICFEIDIKKLDI